jgi:hypothetical protein
MLFPVTGEQQGASRMPKLKLTYFDNHEAAISGCFW